MLNVTDRLCVVVGAGRVGLRKAEALVRAGASVRLVDPRRDARAPDGVEHIRRAYEPSVLDGAFLAFACTDDPELNARIAADARRAGALVNAADQPEDYDFFTPAVTRDGNVVVAVGTGGAAPGLAGQLRQTLARALPERIGQFAAVLDELREEVRSAVSDPGRRGRIMKRLAGEQTYRAFLAGGGQAVREALRRAVEDA